MTGARRNSRRRARDSGIHIDIFAWLALTSCAAPLSLPVASNSWRISSEKAVPCWPKKAYNECHWPSREASEFPPPARLSFAGGVTHEQAAGPVFCSGSSSRQQPLANQPTGPSFFAFPRGCRTRVATIHIEGRPAAAAENGTTTSASREEKKTRRHHALGPEHQQHRPTALLASASAPNDRRHQQ